ncbi:MAG TPA: hypothetical protein VGB85_01125 [Nannocystis sp.]|jgi:hypothetical protein
MPAPEPTKDVSPLMDMLRERWVLTLATSPGANAVDPEPRIPYPTPLFYAVADLPGPPLLVFASRPDSTHGRHLGDGPTAVAAGLYLESEAVAELRGVQLRGEVVRVAGAPAAAGLIPVLRAAYVGRHPAADALLRPGARDELYVLAVTWAKLTDNRRGFGHKLEWRFTTPEVFFAGP